MVMDPVEVQVFLEHTINGQRDKQPRGVWRRLHVENPQTLQIRVTALGQNLLKRLGHLVAKLHGLAVEPRLRLRSASAMRRLQGRPRPPVCVHSIIITELRAKRAHLSSRTKKILHNCAHFPSKMRESSRVMTRNPDTDRRDHGGDFGTWKSLIKATSQAGHSSAGNSL